MIEEYIEKLGLSTLKDASLDDKNNVYMTNLGLKIIDFDSIKQEYTRRLHISENSAKSCDALLTNVSCEDKLKDKESIYFIEFKNGAVKVSDIRIKVKDSLLIYSDIEKIDLSYFREHAEFILVYNSDKHKSKVEIRKKESKKNSEESEKFSKERIRIGQHFSKLGEEEFLIFDIEHMKKMYFKDVHTYDKYEFENYIKEKLEN